MEKQPTERNKQWDLIRAIGIIFVVWGHNYQPPFLFFPAFYFHMSLFFFISGYFFKPPVTIIEKAKYILKKTRKQLIPFFILNLFFGLLTAWFKPLNINLGQDITFDSIFIAPFGRGDQFVLYLASWFLFNLYFISIFAGIIYQKSHKINIGIAMVSFIAMLATLEIGNRPDNSMWVVFLCRSMFGFCFFSMGYLFETYESYIQKFIVHPINVVILYVGVNVLNTFFGNVSYSIMFGNVGNSFVLVPVITSLCIIMTIYILSYYIAQIVDKKSIVYEIGRDSFAIMVLHLTLFFLVNVALYKANLIPFSALSDVYYRYQIEKTWLIYQIPAIIVPIFIVRGYNKLIQSVFHKETKTPVVVAATQSTQIVEPPLTPKVN